MHVAQNNTQNVYLDNPTMLFKVICHTVFFVAVWRVGQCLTKVLCCKVEPKNSSLVNVKSKTYNNTDIMCEVLAELCSGFLVVHCLMALSC